MKKKATILIVVAFLPIIVIAQKWTVAGEVFYGTFKMESMKEYQRSISAWPAPDEFKVVDKFPPYVGYNFLTGYNISPRFNLGIRLQYTSTGGRVAYGDYSGELTVNQLLHAYSLGLNSRYRLKNPSDWETYLSCTAGVMRTSLTNAYSFHLYDVSPSNYEIHFRSYNYFLNPAIIVNRKFKNHFALYANLGYELQIHRTLRLSSDEKQYLKTSNGEDVVAEWDGLRIGIGICYRFKIIKED
jgi:hypothetical protein